jgi:hypothetical protein
VLSKPTAGFKVINRILTGLIATEKAVTWKLAGWPLTSLVFRDSYEYGGLYAASYSGGSSEIKAAGFKIMNLNCMLINNQGKVIGIAKQDVFNHLGFHFISDYSWDYSILNVLPSYGESPETPYPVVFSGVSADDITDDMTISIEVDGRDAQTAASTDYIKISSGNTTWYKKGDNLLQTLLNMDRELYKYIELTSITEAEYAAGKKKERYR